MKSHMRSQKNFRFFLFAASSLCAASALSGCVRTSTMPFRADMIQISTSAAPIFGAQGAQQAALKQGAIETIYRGFDRFTVLGTDAQNNLQVIGRIPATTTTYGSATATSFGNPAFASGQSTTYMSPSIPIIVGSHDQSILVELFKAHDPSGQEVILARDIVGAVRAERAKPDTSLC